MGRMQRAVLCQLRDDGPHTILEYRYGGTDRRGIMWHRRNRWSANIINWKMIERLRENGWVKVRHGELLLTHAGQRLARELGSWERHGTAFGR